MFSVVGLFVLLVLGIVVSASLVFYWFLFPIHYTYGYILFSLFSSASRKAASFSNTDLSVVRLSVRPSVRLSVCPSSSRLRGERVYLRNASVTFFFFGMKLLLGDINHISKDRFG